MKTVIEFLTSLSIWGTVVNAAAIVLGASVGVLIGKLTGTEKKKEGRLSTLPDILMKGVALCTMLIGISGAVKTESIITVILSVTVGAVIGTLCNLDGGMEKLGAIIGKKANGSSGNITQGFVNAGMLFCVGSMAIVGALNSGLSHDHTMLYAKSLLDMISSVIFGATLGVGVIFSSALVLVYQGIISLAASALAPLLSDAVINEMSAVGSLLIIGLAFNMLGLTKIKVMNYVPAVFMPILLMMFIK